MAAFSGPPKNGLIFGPKKEALFSAPKNGQKTAVF
jgi:hypothetical protein